MNIMKILELHMRINQSTFFFFLITYEDYEDHEDLRIPCEKHETNDNFRIPVENYENNTKLRITNARFTKIMKIM